MKRKSVVVVLVLLLAGCSGGSSKVSAAQYVKTLCTSLSAWGNSLQQRTSQVQSVTTGGSSPEEGKKTLQDYLDGVISDTDALLSKLDAAGTPNVSGGEDFAAKVKGAVQDAKAAFEKARSQADALPTDDPTAFKTGAEKLQSDLQSAGSEISDSLSNETNDALDRAFGAEPSCNAIGG